MPLTIIIIALVLVLLIIAFKSIRIVQQGHKAAVQSFGRYVGELGPGLHFVTPIIRNIAYVVDMRQRSLDLDPQEIITKDNVNLTIDASAKYHVDNLEEYLYGNTNPEGLLLLDIQNELRDIIGTMTMAEILGGTNKINTDLNQRVFGKTDSYGVTIDRVNIGEVIPPQSIVEAMNKQITADRERDAALIAADARQKTVEMDTRTQNNKLLADARAHAEKIAIDTQATVAQLTAINNALNESNLNAAALEYLAIDAKKALAEGPNNTVVLMDGQNNAKVAENIASLASGRKVWDEAGK